MSGRVPLLALGTALALLLWVPAAAASPAQLVGLSAWDVVPSPNGGTANNTLEAVSALSATDAWAVGRSRPLQTPPRPPGRSARLRRTIPPGCRRASR